MNKTNEEWREIQGYENLYEVSNLGRIRSVDRFVRHNYGGVALKKGKILKPKPNCTNHCQVGLCKNGKIKYAMVHRLVATAFIPNPNNYPYINHKDENPLNNEVSNLEWCTPQYNTNYGTAKERRAKTHSLNMKGKSLYENNYNAKPILQFSLDGEFIKEWDCAKYAIEEYGLNQSSLSMNLHHKTFRCGNYRWEFKN